MHFWPFRTSETKPLNSETKNELPPSNNFLPFNSFGQQFQEFINNNLPIGFEQKLNKTKPYILASFVAWPLFWLYRGMEWSSHRQSARLPMYIQKTYLQAKCMQFSIIMCGLTVATLMENSGSDMAKNTNNQTK